ncbi:transcription factor A, mitochondrial [Bacillus rossius redtenbacheri]|uniref:transcription factor A, mitochondrial n=1 Tax=Bacillus rossius redtenbacheri TaxID=93214 RepID=UPI002FDCD230
MGTLKLKPPPKESATQECQSHNKFRITELYNFGARECRDLPKRQGQTPVPSNSRTGADVRSTGSHHPLFYTEQYFWSACAQWQQCAGLKQSLEEKMGLPVRPKRPLTPFFRFMAQQRPAYQQKHPDLKITEITKLLARQWEAVQEAERRRLEEDFKRDMAQYTAAVARYEGVLTDAQRDELQQARELTLDSRNRRRLKKKMKDLGKPKKPLSPFLVFVKGKASERKEESFGDWQKQMGAQWALLTDEQRARYTEQFRREMEAYRKELREWEERMIRLGNIDVVRNEALIEPRPRSHKPPT